MADLTDVEVARVGTWSLASGDLTVTEQMLRDAADYAARPDARPAPIKIGHGDPRFDGEPAMGWLSNLRVEGSDGDAVLKGDVTGMPEWLVRAAPSAWPDRSMEGWTDFEVDDRTYGLVVDGLALLGVTPPGMSTIRSLRDLPQALGVAASARIAAAKPVETPELPRPMAASEAPTTAAEAAARIHKAPIRGAQKGATVDLTTEQEKTLRALTGIADGDPLEPDKVLASLSEKLKAPQETEPEPDKPTGTADALAPPSPAVAAAGKAVGMISVSASVWESMNEDIKRLKSKDEKRERDERDAVIDNAIKAGKILNYEKDRYVRLWDTSGPQIAREVIDGLVQRVPVTAMGYTGGPDDPDVDEEFAHLFPPTTTSKGR